MFAKAFKEYKNITIIENGKENFDNRTPEEYNAYIYIGGSIFMEGGKVYNLDSQCNNFIKKCYEKKIPFFYISSNFGPYKTQEYFDLARDTYKYCKDICFRDMYSYELFKDIPTVRYAPDLIFNFENINESNIKKDTIGISVIDMSIREKLRQYEKTYIKCMIQNIIDYIQQGKIVYLFSFCKEENDERTIEIIKKHIPIKYRNKLRIVHYDGNIKEFINIYKSIEYMVCCRFHATVLSIALNQKMYLLSYSKKIDNVIQDLSLIERYSKIESLEENTKFELADFKKVEEKKLLQIKEGAQNQLLKIDEWYLEKSYF